MPPGTSHEGETTSKIISEYVSGGKKSLILMTAFEHKDK